MKVPSIRLKWLIILNLLLLSILLIVGFSMLSSHYFFRGMESVLAGNMEKSARSYLKNVPEAQRNKSGSIDGYYFSNEWSSMPKEAQLLFNQAPKKNNTMYKQKQYDSLGKVTAINFIMRQEINGQTFFIGNHIDLKTGPKVVSFNINQSKQLLFSVSSLTLLFVGVLFWSLARRFTQPINALEKWTRELTPQTLTLPTPDFIYPELNDMAQLIRTSLSSVQVSLDRERDFQRHVSHELRTPVSVIRSNVSLIHKLEQQNAIQDTAQILTIVNRIDRASFTMKSLIHTLLWLSRGGVREALPKETIQLDQLIELLVKEHLHISNNKKIELSVKTSPYTIDCPLEPLRIVIGNLILNSFQHTWEGNVEIIQQKNEVVITNTNEESVNNTEELGFGLGLRLTQELANKMQWVYSNEKQELGHQVYLKIEASR